MKQTINYRALLKGDKMTSSEYNYVFNCSILYCSKNGYVVRSPFIIDDIIIEAIRKAILNIEQFDESKGVIKNWYLTILRNEYYHYYSRIRFKEENCNADIYVINEDGEEEYDPFMYLNIEQKEYDFSIDQRNESLKTYIKENYKELFLFTYKQYSIKDIMKELNIKEHTVKNQLFHQRKKNN